MPSAFKSPLQRSVSRIARLVLSVALVSVASACAAETSSTNEAVANNPLSTRLAPAVAELEAKGFSGIVAVAPYEGEPVFIGIGDVTEKGVADRSTQVDSGSITKTITAAAALKLVDEGLLKISDRLADHFPETPADKAGITVFHLLTHSSGLPGAVASDEEEISREDLIARAMASPLMFTPGAGYEYSNVGYSLVAAIIEKLTGKSFFDFVKQDLLFGHDYSGFTFGDIVDETNAMRTADGQSIVDASWGGHAPGWALTGNGGVAITADSIIAFRKLFSSGKLISPAAVEFAQSPLVREGEGAPSHYGFGMVVEDHPQLGKIYWHNGGNEYFLANWTDYADHGIIVFTASNYEAFNADDAAAEIARALFFPAN